MITRDLECPWHDYCIICSLWRHGRWFRKFAVLFRPIRKELESSMYNNKQLLDEVFVISRIIKVEVRVISRSRRLRLITLTETLIILDITKTESNNCFIIHWTKKKSHVFASSLTASNTKRANLTWLPLKIMHLGHTWHDYPWPWHDYSWPWHDYCIICSLWRHGRWFRKFAVLFRPIRKELESSMYNKRSYRSSFGHLFTSFNDRWSSFTPLQTSQSQNRWIKLNYLRFVCNWNCFEWIELAVFLLTIIAGFPRATTSLFFNAKRQTCLRDGKTLKVVLCTKFCPVCDKQVINRKCSRAIKD